MNHHFWYLPHIGQIMMFRWPFGPFKPHPGEGLRVVSASGACLKLPDLQDCRQLMLGRGVVCSCTGYVGAQSKLSNLKCSPEWPRVACSMHYPAAFEKQRGVNHCSPKHIPARDKPDCTSFPHHCRRRDPRRLLRSPQSSAPDMHAQPAPIPARQFVRDSWA